jgi:hypothetical protein
MTRWIKETVLLVVTRFTNSNQRSRVPLAKTQDSTIMAVETELVKEEEPVPF